MMKCFKASRMRFKFKQMLGMVVISTSLLLQGCGGEQEAALVEIKPAVKLSNDATTYAKAAWTLMNDVDVFVYKQQRDQIETQVRQPARKLSTDWRIHVKMTDSVTEGKYALCRKALTSLEIWARATVDKNPSLAAKKADYERDKLQCQNAIEHPELGNTDPKQKGNAVFLESEM